MFVHKRDINYEHNCTKIVSIQGINIKARLFRAKPFIFKKLNEQILKDSFKSQLK